MISVQNRLRLLSGNSVLALLIGVFVFMQSCGSLSPASTGGVKDKPTKTEPTEQDETLPPIEGTRVYDPVQQKWVTIDTKPKEKMDTLQFAEAPTSQIPPITMDGVDRYLPEGLSTTEVSGQYNISVLLPFMANRTNAETEKITDPRSNFALQFYSGMKLALEKLEGTDIGLNINVMDTESNPAKVERLLDTRSEMQQSNIIIGPYRRDNIKLVAEFAKQEGKLMISPYSASTNLTEGNPNFIQVSPSLFTHCENLLQHARTVNEFEPEEILLISRDIPIELMGVATIQKEHFNVLGTTFADSLQHIVAPANSEELFDFDINPYFEAEDKLAVIIPSWADETFVYGLLRKIDLARKEYQRVVVYGMPQWMDFEQIDFEYYEKLNVHISANAYVDNKDDEVKQFRRNFYDQFGILPNETAFLGHDITIFLAQRLQTEGVDFIKRLDGNPQTLMHTRFDFQKVYQDDPSAVELQLIDRMENKYVNILEFSNYSFQLSNN